MICRKQESTKYHDASELLEQLRHYEQENNRLLRENNDLKNKNENLNKQNEQLAIQIGDFRTAVTQVACKTKETSRKEERTNQINLESLQKVFTPGQIKVVMSSEKRRVNWSSEDIISAIMLRSLSPKAYRFLRNVKEMPLPSESTLRKWVSSFNIYPDRSNKNYV